MQKALLIIGKTLIICGPLFPIPLGYVLYPWFGYKIGMPMWGEKMGYWWPLLLIMGFGLLLCLISRFKAKDVTQYANLPFRDTITAFLLKLICGGLLLVGGFMLLTLVIIGFWYLFLTERVLITIPILICIALLWFGYVFYRDNNKHDE